MISAMAIFFLLKKFVSCVSIDFLFSERKVIVVPGSTPIGYFAHSRQKFIWDF